MVAGLESALLYPASDNKLYKYTLDGNKTDVLVSGDVIEFGNTAVVRPQWSPDGKWVSYAKADGTLLPHVFIIPAAGGKERRITGEESYSDTNALWTSDGKHVVYLSGLDVGNIGVPNRNNTAQIHSVSLVPENRPASEKGVDSEAEAAATPQRSARPTGQDGSGRASQPKVDVKIDFDHMERRSRQITRSADTISGMALTPDGKSVLFVTNGVEGGRPVNSIWTATLDGEKVTRRDAIEQPGRRRWRPAHSGPRRIRRRIFQPAIRQGRANLILPPGPWHLCPFHGRRRFHDWRRCAAGGDWPAQRSPPRPKPRAMPMPPPRPAPVAWPSRSKWKSIIPPAASRCLAKVGG